MSFPAMQPSSQMASAFDFDPSWLASANNDMDWVSLSVSQDSCHHRLISFDSDIWTSPSHTVTRLERTPMAQDQSLPKGLILERATRISGCKPGDPGGDRPWAVGGLQWSSWLAA